MIELIEKGFIFYLILWGYMNLNKGLKVVD